MTIDLAAHSRWSVIMMVAVTIPSRLPTASAAEGTAPFQNLESRSVGVRVIPRPAKTPCARTNCYPLLPVTRIRCAKTGVTRVGVIQ